MIWAVTPTGKKVPLDARAEVYRVVEDAHGNAEAVPATDCYVSHFKTCPKASSFSKGGSNGPAG